MNAGVPVREVPIAWPVKPARPAAGPGAWSTERVLALFELPFNDLMFQAQQVHRAHHPAHQVQLASLLSIKTGGCPEDCGYCSQSAHHDTGLAASKLMDVGEVAQAAAAAKAQGATRFCMGAAWRETKDRDIDALQAMVREVKALGLETCMTLGMLQPAHAQALKDAGLDYYNHNLDTSPGHYGRIVGTRTYDERLQTLGHVREAGIRVCCGGIVGMGESRADRAALIAQLASLDPPPESVPINNLIPIPGTPLQDAEPIDPFEFVRTVAVARITMPTSVVRLSAGREHMDDALQALCFLAGASSIFCGDRLLTAGNPQLEHDLGLLQRLDLVPQHA